MHFLISIAMGATPLAGLEYRPLGRADLEAVERDATSGLLVGELDGLVRPNLSAFIGARVSERVAVLGSLGVARVQTTIWEDEIFVQRHWGVVRPGLDVRGNFRERLLHRPLLYGIVGVYGDIPSVRDNSNGYDEDEQLAADRGATSDRERLSGIGARAGFGVEWRVHPYLSLGGQGTLSYSQRLYTGNQPATITSQLATDVSLVAMVAFPTKKDAQIASPDDNQAERDAGQTPQ